MAFRKKAAFILPYKPDVLIVPECEHPDKLKFADETSKPKDILWFGKNLNKGLGIFSYGQFRFKLHNSYNPDIQLIIPVEVTGGEYDFLLFAIWANNPTDSDGRYVEQIWKAVHFYDALMPAERTILIGDFNSNTIWDRNHRIGNHSDVVGFLEKKEIYSTYHAHCNQIQGEEEHPTLYMYRHKDKPYHIDYCFASKDLIDKIQSVEIGEYDSWIQHSDHVPLIVTTR